MSEILEKLFGSKARVKILRLFLFNPKTSFSVMQITEATGTSKRTARSNSKRLQSIGILEKVKLEGEGKARVGWRLNESFPYRQQLHSLMIGTETFDRQAVERDLKSAGIQAAVLSGIFVNEEKSPVDLLLVGIDVDDKHLSQLINETEQRIGAELRYTLFSPESFEYRKSMFDRLVRDVMEYEHQVLFNNTGITLKEED